MSNIEDKNIDQKIEKLEAIADPNTVISIGGYSFTPAKLFIAGTIVSSFIGGLFGMFEFYKDYVGMKEAIQNYTAPDLSEYEKRIVVLEQNLEKGVEYTREINVNLKSDIRRIEGIVDNVERGAKGSQREVEKEVAAIRQQVDSENKESRRGVDQSIREMQKQVDSTMQNINERVNRIERETGVELRNIRREVDDKIKKALDNPLAN
jgi:BMFP domain-containing protein YqiC